MNDPKYMFKYMDENLYYYTESSEAVPRGVLWKHLCQSPFVNKVAYIRTATLLK